MKFEIAIMCLICITALIGLYLIGYVMGRSGCPTLEPVIIERNSTSTEEILSHSTTTEYITDDECQRELQYCWSIPDIECPPLCDYREYIDVELELTGKLEQCLSDLLNGS